MLATAEKQPGDRAIIVALCGTGSWIEELVQLRLRQLVADIECTARTATSAALRQQRLVIRPVTPV